MASKFILVVKNGGITKATVRKPQAPRKDMIAWKSNAAGVALGLRAKHYAFRYKGRWHVLGVDHPTPIKSFPEGDYQAAAEMWLLAFVSRKQA